MNTRLMVVALGGNAILKNGQAASAESQQRACEETARQLVKIVKDGWDVVITHGNGPQVGNIVLQQQATASEKLPPMPLDTCDAMSQGMIGYWLQRAIDVETAREGWKKESITVLTQVVVDPKDPAFLSPTKPIGPFYTAQEAAALAETNGYKVVEDSGRGWRRVVPSPQPVEIMEIGAIRNLLDRGVVVIAAGGGGIPVVKNEDGSIEGVEAVIDKDFAAAKLAESINAQVLLILTGVENVCIHYRTEQQKELGAVSIEEMEHYISEGHFPPGSMLPKVEAAIQFVKSGSGRQAIITSLEKAAEAITGNAGTRIT